ncbi:MAG: 16S rRNA (adenine(1518)-N(6)/adenine(1519)-N(6))-dimethyltransferase RsmA [Oscillospiraceae bacterium]|nr:16S rRNA (adenine(1518)-N(6)/adenine(1519)-N(6))-dimethyltransferase RsmA [Oscillospiraceae bacterium]
MTYDLCDIGVIRGLLEESGFRFSKSMGQNFLVDRTVPERIAEESRADKGSFVLEVGPGVGCLTRELAVLAGKVVAVEIDKRLPDVLKKTLADCPNVELVRGDILKTDIPALVRERAGELTPRVCANLPYNITSPALTALLTPRLFETVTVMIQREAAMRLCAAPGTSDYGAFTVFVNWYAEPETLFDVPPSCFIPRPKVTSTVVRLRRRTAPPVSVNDESLFFRVVRASFAQRRKTLLNGLASAFGQSLSRDALETALESCGLPAQTRGETLDIGTFARLSDALGSLL